MASASCAAEDSPCIQGLIKHWIDPLIMIKAAPASGVTVGLGEDGPSGFGLFVFSHVVLHPSIVCEEKVASASCAAETTRLDVDSGHH